MIDTYIKDPEEKLRIFNSIENIPSVAKKALWAYKWIENKEVSFATRLIAFAIVEGVFFSGSFCAIYWLKKRGLMPGLTFSNELISRDEGMHVENAVEIYDLWEEKIHEEEIYELLNEAILVEKEFILDSIPCKLIGMNSELMSQYIEYVADRLLKQFGYKPLYNSENPFDFMELMSLHGKTNFFEKKVSEYSLANVQNKINSKSSNCDDFNNNEEF